MSVHPAPIDPVRPLPNWLAVLLVVGTSAAVLVLEILAGRLLAPYVGVSLETYTGIIGTVLAGIALGAWAGGAVADRVDPRRMLPALLVAGGGAALATIPLVRVFGEGFGTGGPGALLLTAVGFLPSATILSAVPPAVVKLQLRDLGATGTVVGRLSAYGTAGAIVGTFLTGYVLVTVAAVTTLIVTVGTVLVVAGLAVGIGSRRPAPAGEPRTTVIALAVAAVAGMGVVATQDPCAVRTAYYCVAIEETNGGDRVLILDDLRHSYVDPDDPTTLGFWYTRRFADAIDLHVRAERPDVVHVGGGALTMATWVTATRPGSRHVVLELDGDLVDLVVDEFDRSIGATPGGGRIDVDIGDARTSLATRPDDSADVVLGDAFGSRAVPWHLTTNEFVADVDRVLRRDGLYVLNIIDEGSLRFVRAEAATVADVFEFTAVVLSTGAAGGVGGNAVIVAAHQPLDTDRLEAALATDPRGGELVANLTAFTADAELLTDDFAPVDQLIAGG